MRPIKDLFLIPCKYSSINGQFLCAQGRECKVTEEELDETFDNCPKECKVICNNGRPIYEELDKYTPVYLKKKFDKEEDDPFGSEIRDKADKIRLTRK